MFDFLIIYLDLFSLIYSISLYLFYFAFLLLFSFLLFINLFFLFKSFFFFSLSIDLYMSLISIMGNFAHRITCFFIYLFLFYLFICFFYTWVTGWTRRGLQVERDSHTCSVLPYLALPRVLSVLGWAGWHVEAWVEVEGSGWGMWKEGEKGIFFSPTFFF